MNYLSVLSVNKFFDYLINARMSDFIRISVRKMSEKGEDRMITLLLELRHMKDNKYKSRPASDY